MATTFQPRPQPCTGCGRKVIVVQTRESGLGGLLRPRAKLAVQHADFEPGLDGADQVDDLCRREPE